MPILKNKLQKIYKLNNVIFNILHLKIAIFSYFDFIDIAVKGIYTYKKIKEEKKWEQFRNGMLDSTIIRKCATTCLSVPAGYV